jgi:hypothetical protein
MRVSGNAAKHKHRNPFIFPGIAGFRDIVPPRRFHPEFGRSSPVEVFLCFRNFLFQTGLIDEISIVDRISSMRDPSGFPEFSVAIKPYKKVVVLHSGAFLFL